MTTTVAPNPAEAPAKRHSKRRPSALTLAGVWQALPGAVRKLDPRLMWRNPVMLIVEAGAVLVTAALVIEPSIFTAGIAVWLWLTVLFANLAESVAEGRGKAQAESLRKTRTATSATLVEGYDEKADAGAERATTRHHVLGRASRRRHGRCGCG